MLKICKVLGGGGEMRRIMGYVQMVNLSLHKLAKNIKQKDIKKYWSKAIVKKMLSSFYGNVFNILLSWKEYKAYMSFEYF